MFMDDHGELTKMPEDAEKAKSLEERCNPILIVHDDRSSSIFSYVLSSKGLEGESIRHVERDIQDLPYAGVRIALKGDQEPSIVRFRTTSPRAAWKARPVWRTPRSARRSPAEMSSGRSRRCRGRSEPGKTSSRPSPGSPSAGGRCFSNGWWNGRRVHCSLSGDGN